MVRNPDGSGKWLGRWCVGSLSLWRRSWRQRRAWRRLWWAGSIGGSSHHPRLLGLSSPGVCRPRGAALRPCAPRGHVELTLLCCCCGVSWAWIPSHNFRCVVLLSDRLQSPESLRCSLLVCGDPAGTNPGQTGSRIETHRVRVMLTSLLCVLFQVRRQRSQ